MKDNKYLNSTYILEIDKVLANKLSALYDKKRKDAEDSYNNLKDGFTEFIENNASNTIEDIEDYFIDLNDYIKENYHSVLSIKIISNYNNLLCKLYKLRYLDKPNFTYDEKSTLLKDNVVYYFLSFLIRDDTEDKVNIEDIINNTKSLLEKEYSISIDENKQKNTKFKLTNIKSYSINTYSYTIGTHKEISIILEQLD